MINTLREEDCLNMEHYKKGTFLIIQKCVDFVARVPKEDAH